MRAARSGSERSQPEPTGCLGSWPHQYRDDAISFAARQETGRIEGREDGAATHTVWSARICAAMTVAARRPLLRTASATSRSFWGQPTQPRPDFDHDQVRRSRVAGLALAPLCHVRAGLHVGASRDPASAFTLLRPPRSRQPQGEADANRPASLAAVHRLEPARSRPHADARVACECASTRFCLAAAGRYSRPACGRTAVVGGYGDRAAVLRVALPARMPRTWHATMAPSHAGTLLNTATTIEQ